MDHVIEYILSYMEMDVEAFQEEWASGKYEKISDCPTYNAVKAYCNAIKALNIMDGRFSGYTPKHFIELSETF